jgi:hypothetical protein
MRINTVVQPEDLRTQIRRLWGLSGTKIQSIEAEFDFAGGAPVFTVEGKYCVRGWTAWTIGFHYGSALLHFDATGEEAYLEIGRQGTVQKLASHVTHMGVHDHGFNSISTYGALRRLMLEHRLPFDRWELRFYEMALRASAAVQASRWTETPEGGFIFSFNGPHSLFSDTMRSLRVLAVGHQLGHVLMAENDLEISLLDRLIQHARMTAQYNIYYGSGRDAWDIRGRVAHESIFNPRNGTYRCPSSQQGYSSRSTWTRGLSWVILGFAEQLEFLATVADEELEKLGGRETIEGFMLDAATAASDFYIQATPANGIPYWDTGAPGLNKIDEYLDQPADPYNDHEPVDSSAASIAAQGLLRLGRFLDSRREIEAGQKYWQAGLTVLSALFDAPYLSSDPDHQGLILHSVYHRPNAWDHVPDGRNVPCGESSMWGDYHAREAALYVQKIFEEPAYLTFWGEGVSR